MAMLLAPSLPAPAAPAPTAGNVGLVIAYGNGRVEDYCFSVPAGGVSGLELLQRAGVPVRADYVGLGAEVCAINGVGCLDPGQPCYCQCQGTPCLYWQYSQWRNGRWAAATLGAGSTVVRPGGIEGWGWGANPPSPAGAALCALASPPAATAPKPTAPPAPTRPSRPTPLPPTHAPRPQPSATPHPIPTAAPQRQPSASPRTQPATASPLPTTADTPAASPTETMPSGTDTPSAAPTLTAPTGTDTPSAPPTGTAQATESPSPSATPSGEGSATGGQLPAGYFVFGLVVLGLVGVIAWARRK